MTEWKKPELNDEFMRAVTVIQKRAENQRDWYKLLDTYVQTDLAYRAGTRDSQLVLGRRGTGKTHMFLVLQEKLGSQGEVAFYIDCRKLGSGVVEQTEKPELTASKYFRSLLNEISTIMFDKASHMESPPVGAQQRVLNTIYGLATQMEPSRTDDFVKPTFNYRQIAESLQTVIADLGMRNLFIIIDEWAQIPISVQPYVAEYLKRAIMTIPQVCVKLLTVNYQCQLSKQTAEGIIGIKRGADITDVVDFDAYLIYDDNPKLVTEFFSQVLYNHLGVELGWNLQVPSDEKAKRITNIFTQQNTFVELVRAAEGNCRDFLCIFSGAFWKYRQRGDAKAISIPHIHDAASDWFTNEKYVNIKDEAILNRTFLFILNNILKRYKSRTFMVEASKAQSGVLTRLLNERLLHRLPRFYSHQDYPGERYELFNIDYGAYVQFKILKEYQPPLLALDSPELTTNEQRFMVPFDDKRSIRRIVFDPDALKITT